MHEQLNPQETQELQAALVAAAFDKPQAQLTEAWGNLEARKVSEAGSGRHRKAYTEIADKEAGEKAMRNHQARLVAHIAEEQAQGRDVNTVRLAAEGRHRGSPAKDEFALTAQYSGSGSGEVEDPREDPRTIRVGRQPGRDAGLDRTIGVGPDGNYRVVVRGQHASPAPEAAPQTAAPSAEPVRLLPVVPMPTTGSTSPTDLPFMTRQLPDTLPDSPDTDSPGSAATHGSAEQPHTTTAEEDSPPTSAVRGGGATPGTPPAGRHARRSDDLRPAYVPSLRPGSGGTHPDPESVQGQTVEEIAAGFGFEISGSGRVCRRNRNNVLIPIGVAFEPDGTTPKPGIFQLMEFAHTVDRRAAERAGVDTSVSGNMSQEDGKKLHEASRQIISEMTGEEMVSQLRAMAQNVDIVFGMDDGWAIFDGSGHREVVNIWQDNLATLRDTHAALARLAAATPSGRIGVRVEPYPASDPAAEERVPSLPAAEPAQAVEEAVPAPADTDIAKATDGGKWWLDPSIQGTGAPTSGADSSASADSAPTPSTSGRHRGGGRVRRFLRQNRKELLAIAGGAAAIGALAVTAVFLGGSSSSEQSEYQAPAPTTSSAPATPNAQPSPSATAAPAEQTRPAAPTTAPASPTALPSQVAPSGSPAAPNTIPPKPATPPPITGGATTPPAQPAAQPRAEVQNPLDTIRFTTENGRQVVTAIANANGTTSNAIYDGLEANNPARVGNLATTYKFVNDLEKQGFDVDQIQPGQEFKITFDADGTPQTIARK